MELLQSVTGVVIALALSRSPQLSLCGGLISGVVGGLAIPAYFCSNLLLRSGYDLFGAGTKFERVLDLNDCERLMRHRAINFSMGLLLGVAAVALGWQSLPIGASACLAIFGLLWAFGSSFSFWLLLLICGGLVWLGSYFSLSGAALVVLMFLGSIQQTTQLREGEQTCFGLLHSEPFLWLTGIFSAVVPALNPCLYLDKDTEAWTTAACADGFSLAISMLARDSSKTALGTIVSQFGGELNPYLVIVTVASCLGFCLLPGSVRFCAQAPNVPSWVELTLLLSVGAWYLNVPGQPLISFGLAGGLYFGAKLLGYFTLGLPPKFQLGLGAGPIVLF